MDNKKCKGLSNFDTLTMDQILNMPPGELIVCMRDRFSCRMPNNFETIDDLKELGRAIIRINGEYAYLMNLLAMAKMRKRELKRLCASKEEIEDALMREEIMGTYVDIMKNTYNALSRLITIKQQINEELKFTDGK